MSFNLIRHTYKFLALSASLLMSNNVHGQNVFPSTGKVGLGTTQPTEMLDIAGKVLLRNMDNLVGAGSSIQFSSYSSDHPGPKIRSYLEMANGKDSYSKLILSSYSSKYGDELTLSNGNVGIGTLNPQNKLSVNGLIRAVEIRVEAQNWPDYVFDKEYSVMPLKEIDQFVKTNKHLPGVPTASDVTKNGIELGEMSSILLRKIEELTLHLIAQDKLIDSLLKGK
jgi:hypothetical protein